MTMNRRNLLKALAAIPAIPFLSSRLAHALVAGDTPSNTYLLFHGLFFLEFVGDKLYVATPQHSAHAFYMRPHGGGFQPLPKDISFSSSGLGAGSMNSFPADIPQFPRSMLSKNPVLPSISTYQSRLTLPLPKNIFAFRNDKKNNFHPDRSTSVGKAAFGLAGPNVATITCLEYDPGTTTAAFVNSYYAEHCEKPNLNGVNAALKAAAVPGFLGPNFNLKMDQPSPDATLDTDDVLPDGVTSIDEYEFSEFKEVKPPDCVQPLTPKTATNIVGIQPQLHVDLASCPQFGLRS